MSNWGLPHFSRTLCRLMHHDGPPAMDAVANENEVRLRKGTSLNERLVLAGIALVLCLIALPGLAHLANEQWLGIAALFALLFGCLLLGAALLDRNVVWIITPGEILIGEQRPFGKLHRRLIRDDEISGMRLRRSIGKSVEFSLVFETESGDMLTSPPLPDVTQVHKTTCGFPGCCGFLIPNQPRIRSTPSMPGYDWASRSTPNVYSRTGFSSHCSPALWPFRSSLGSGATNCRPLDRRRGVRRDPGLPAAQISPSDQCILDRP